jgi:hypothetical protein
MIILLSMVMLTYDLNTQEAEAVGLWVWGQSRTT